MTVNLHRRMGYLIAFVCLLGLTALACSQQPTPEPSVTELPTSIPDTPTVSATATFVPTSTPTATPTAQIDPTAPPEPTPTESPTAIPTATSVPPVPTPTPAPKPTVAPSATAVPTATAMPTATEVPAPKPRPIEGTRGGSLRFSVPTAPPHQDIHESVSPVLAAWGPGVAYSKIFRHQWNNPGPIVSGGSLPAQFDPTTSAYAGDILCDICMAWRMDDTTSITVVLRPDVKWQDVQPLRGRSLVAQDVAYSLNRLRNPVLQNHDLMNTVSSVRAIDEATVVIETTLPDAEIFEKLADARAAIVASEAVALNSNLRTGPTVGTGPWILGRYEQMEMSFSANLDYFNPALPLTFAMHVSIVPDISTRVVMIQVDASDFVQTDVESLRQALARDPATQWTAEFDAASGIEVAFNTTAPSMSDIRVRRAILNLWQPESLFPEVHGGLSFVSAGIPLRDPAWLLTAQETGEYFDDPNSAQALLRAAGGTGGQVTITVGSFGEAYTQTALSLAGAIRSAGFVPNIQYVSTREFADEVWINGDFEVYVGAPPPQSSATSMLFSVHHSRGPWNSTRFASSELDDLISRQTTQLNPSARREDLREIQRLIFSSAHRFIAAANVSTWVWSPKVQNFAPNSYRGGSHWLSRIWLLE